MSTRFSSSDLGGGSHWNNMGNQGEKYKMSKENERKSMYHLISRLASLMVLESLEKCPWKHSQLIMAKGAFFNR